MIFLVPPAMAGDKPNILLILADDLGYGDVACYNPESKVPTPRLDRLAGQGMRFTDAHSPATVCTPSRYSILTGGLCFRTGGSPVFTGAVGPSLIRYEHLTLPETLREVGYATAMFGKWHIGLTLYDKQGQPIHNNGPKSIERIDYSRRIDGGPLDHGFGQFFGTACCPTTDWLYAYIEGARIPHPPVGLIDKSAYPKKDFTVDFRDGWASGEFDETEVDMLFLEKSRTFLREHVKAKPGQPFFLLHSMQAVHLPSIPAKQFRGKTNAGPHGDFIYQLDWIVGELMDELEALGVADDSYNLLPVVKGQEVKSMLRPYMIQQTTWEQKLSIRVGQWKHLDHKGSGGNDYDRDNEAWSMKPYQLPDTDPDAPGQLYNLAEDPGETENLYSKQPNLVTGLEALLDASIASGRSAPPR